MPEFSADIFAKKLKRKESISHRDIIDHMREKYGTIAAAAIAIRISDPTIHQWYAREEIPTSVHAKIAVLLSSDDYPIEFWLRLLMPDFEALKIRSRLIAKIK